MAVHELKVNDFFIYQWEPIQTFPQNGMEVEVQDEHGEVYRAKWYQGRIMVDSDGPVRLLHWRRT